MTATKQHLAVLEALDLSPGDLRELADRLERGQPTYTAAEVAARYLLALPRHHRYEKSLMRLTAWAGDRNACDLSADDIRTWSRRAGDEARKDPRARHGVGAEETFVLAVRAAYAAAAEAGLVGHNPAGQVKLPERPSSRRTALSAEQLAEIRLAAISHSREPGLDDLVFQLLRETACRRQGVLRLTVQRLAPETRTIHLAEKYGKQRWIPVSAHLMRRLSASAAERHPGCDRVFHRRDGGHLGDKWFEGFARRVQTIRWAGELGVSAHWIRHTTLTDVERLAGIRVAAAYAGHADAALGVTGIYTKPSEEELRLAHERLFFDDPAHAADPDVAPFLLRRVGRPLPPDVTFR